MSRRRLPNVIMRVSDDDMSGAPVGLGAADVQSVPPTETSAHVIAAFGRDSDPVASGAETAPEAASASSTLPQPASLPDPATARRRARALRIVDRYAVYSAVGGIVPLPLVNVATITGLIVRMIKVLSDHYGVAFEKDRARAIEEPIDLGAPAQKDAAQDQPADPVGMRFGVVQCECRAPRSAEQQPLVDPELLPQ